MYNRILFLNTFTADGLGGNPTAVYVSHKKPETESMQLLAKELHVPVTAFVWEEDSGCCIRYFTTQCEIGACGHATLGAAAVCAQMLRTSSVNFLTAAGESISATVNGGNVSLLYPRRTLTPATAQGALLDALGLNAEDIGETYRYSRTLVLLLRSAGRVRNLRPAFRRLQNSSSRWEEVVVTSASDDNRYDYILRSFCPWIGIDEDPVTGSVQAALAPFWSQRSGKERLTAYQASSRGGELLLTWNGQMVHIEGQYSFLSDLPC